MTQLCVMDSSHEKWESVAAFAESCPWGAGKTLAHLMRSGTFKDWERVIAAFENKSPVGFCTLTEKDELDTKYSYCVFIGFLYVGEAHRGNRLSEKMIRKAIKYASTCGYKKVHIMSGEKGLYEKYGFEFFAKMKTVWAEESSCYRRKINAK